MAQKESATMQICLACGMVINTTKAEPLARIACLKCGEKMRVGRVFDQFVLFETLGVGGMGMVYKARDTLLDREVALELLGRDSERSPEQTKQLQQDARVVASVNHPNVMQVFSSGIDHGQFYLVMELVDCGSLEDLIEQHQRLREKQIIETGIQATKAYAKGVRNRRSSCNRTHGWSRRSIIPTSCRFFLPGSITASFIW